ncbi:lisH domain-containing protein C16orf63 [Strigomonas culicis]|uniref:Centrosomal protein 20 n=1 Tax=Strigomonas culicis TaxID=28005 RepID=S9UJM9_9TRYP|nr:lisH domain-containing protein C16orf63 [Strigomonas culicis]EPY31022.1 lisH domain-containing protein C16orf63 [Strigomonas culicis]EPY33403.1 lisH domain-containing protein C16orf63 [Strigomonas culicis]|eukprot:EPY28108.1 lisH domain-containing protein C16orf63 [Strigomonas culicis]
MSTQESLKSAMRESLEANGTIDQVKAELRAAIFQSLAETTTTDPTNNHLNSSSASQITPPVPPENMIINELIREYLAFNGLEHSLAVFQLESRTPGQPVPRAVLTHELNLLGAPAGVPLLYAMLHEARLSKDL